MTNKIPPCDNCRKEEHSACLVNPPALYCACSCRIAEWKRKEEAWIDSMPFKECKVKNIGEPIPCDMCGRAWHVKCIRNLYGNWREYREVSPTPEFLVPAMYCSRCHGLLGQWLRSDPTASDAIAAYFARKERSKP